MKLVNNGYGGEFCIGSLKDFEVKNIKFLLERFTESFIFDYNTIFSNKSKSFFEYDDIYQEYNSTEPSFSLEDDEGNYITHIDELQIEIKENNIDFNDGFYLYSTNLDHGEFATYTLPTEIKDEEDFDLSKFSVVMSDLSLIGFSDYLVDNVTYNGLQLEANFDEMVVDHKAFEMSLIYVKDSEILEGLDVLEVDYERVLEMDSSEISFSQDILLDYLSVRDEIEKNIMPDFINKHFPETLVLVAPFLYEKFQASEIDLLWMNEKAFKYAFRTLKEELPDRVKEMIYHRCPEWLI